jgi:6-pyruvoyltetrahydropterin/6-carboxytetrahydropterin synthase
MPFSVFTVSRDFTFCYGHRLLNYNGKCAHLHGHNGLVHIVLRSAELNGQGMVLDFSELKNTVGKYLEEELDHRTILQRNDPLVPVLQELDEPLFLLDVPPTAENLAKLLFEKTAAMGFAVESVRFSETDKCAAEYRQE